MNHHDFIISSHYISIFSCINGCLTLGLRSDRMRSVQQVFHLIGSSTPVGFTIVTINSIHYLQSATNTFRYTYTGVSGWAYFSWILLKLCLTFHKFTAIIEDKMEFILCLMESKSWVWVDKLACRLMLYLAVNIN